MGAAVTSGRAGREGEAERREAERREAERGRGGAGRGGGRGDAGACGLGVEEMERGDRGEGQLREASGVRKARPPGGHSGGCTACGAAAIPLLSPLPPLSLPSFSNPLFPYPRPAPLFPRWSHPSSTRCWWRLERL
ncbi:unnamed protein product [Closterium sp. NIES-65]|nr:unnamed protein product [Closterium sp. NIES-65]